MLKKLLVALFASAFALTAFAQAPKSDTAPKSPAATEAKKDAAPADTAAKAEKKKSKGKAKAKAKGKAKAKAKADEKKS